jgi:hypothetical protein
MRRLLVIATYEALVDDNDELDALLERDSDRIQLMGWSAREWSTPSLGRTGDVE